MDEVRDNNGNPSEETPSSTRDNTGKLTVPIMSPSARDNVLMPMSIFVPWPSLEPDNQEEWKA